jgi:hypothetical protein
MGKVSHPISLSVSKVFKWTCQQCAIMTNCKLYQLTHIWTGKISYGPGLPLKNSANTHALDKAPGYADYLIIRLEGSICWSW